MSELNYDLDEQEPIAAEPSTTNAPMIIAIVCALALLALFAAVESSDAQTRTGPTVAFGSIAGRITTGSATGKPLSGVRVVAKRTHSGVADFYFYRLTAADGSYEFKYLLPGRYTVEIDERTVPEAVFPARRNLLILDVRGDEKTAADLAIVRRVDDTASHSESINTRH